MSVICGFALALDKDKKSSVCAVYGSNDGH